MAFFNIPGMGNISFGQPIANTTTPTPTPTPELSPSSGYQNLINRMQSQTPVQGAALPSWMSLPNMNTMALPQPSQAMPTGRMGMMGGGFGNMGGYGGMQGYGGGGFMSRMYNSPQMMSRGYQPQMGNPYARMGGMMQQQPQQMYGNRQFMNSMMQQRPYQQPQLGQDTLNRLNNTSMLQRGQLSNRTGMPAPSSRRGGRPAPTALLQRQTMLQQLQQRNQGRPQYSTGYNPGPAFFGDFANQNASNLNQGGVQLPLRGGGFLSRLAPLRIN